MTKLIIQIPCLNEAADLPRTLACLPRRVPGVTSIEILVIDDGSTDNTAQIARTWGVHHVVRHRTNRGLAAAFQSGVDAALSAGAHIIVNTDADGQYAGDDIAALVAPIVEGRADIVIGDRSVGDNAHFGLVKRQLQKLGSAVVQRLSNVQVSDAVSGFRALSREAAQRINITTEFSYTTDMLIQAGRKRLAIVSVPIRTNQTDRPSRLFKSIPQFIARQLVTMARAYATYNPLRVFALLGGFAATAGLIPILRFVWFWVGGDGQGHVQSLVIGAALIVVGVMAVMFGIVADLIGANRKLLESNLMRLRALEDRLEDQVRESAPSASALEESAGRRAA